MTVLVFNHAGWEVATSSWTVATKSEREITLCYTWGADKFDRSDQSVSTARLYIAISMRDFLTHVAGNAIVDLRRLT